MSAAFGTEAHASDNSGSLTSFACGKPAGTASGDLLVATVSTGSGSSGFTAPSGWSRAPSPLNVDWTDSNDSAGAVFTKVAGSSEPASYTFSWTTASPVNISIVRITGSNGTIRSIRRDTAGGTGASFTSTALSGTQTGDLIVAAGVMGDDFGVSGSTITPPASPWATINNFAASGSPKYQASSWLAGPQSTHTATFQSSSSTAWWNIITYAVEASSGAAVALTTPNVALGAPLVTPSGGGTIALTTPNVALAAPLVSPVVAKTVALTTPNLALAAPLLTPEAGATVALTTPNLALAAPLVTPSAGATVALTAPNIALAAPLVTPALAIPLTTPNLALAAPLPTPSAGATVALTAPNIALAAPPVTPSGGAVTVALTTPNLALAAPLPALPPPPFPQSPLDLECQLNLAGTWTDVTSFAYQRDGSQAPVTITRGRPDESSQANPATCAWQWNNRDGRFSPKNPLSPYYGKLGRNTPVRWSVPAQSSYLRLENNNADRAYVNDNANIDISGSIEIRIALRVTGWQGGVLAHKYDAGGCWFWQLRQDGNLVFAWFDSSSNFWEAVSTVPVPCTSGDFALRVTMDAATGTVTFYVAPSIDGAYSQLGDAASPTGGAATSIAIAHGSAFTVGYIFSFAPGQVFGRVYEARLYNGIETGGTLLTEAGGTLLAEAGGSLLAETAGGGTVAADAVFSAVPAGAASWTDAQGNLWQLAGGAEISDRDYRFHGEMSSQPPKWDVTGTDHYVAAQAGGPLRRLSQGTSNAMSAMKRAISLLSGDFAPVAYWPMEDAQGATQFGSSVGPYPMTFTSPAPQLAADSSFAGSAPLPTLNGSILQGQVAPYTSTGTWVVRGLLKVSPPSAGAVLLRIVTQPGAACPVIYILVDTGGNLALEGWLPGGGSAFNTGFFNFGATEPLMFSVEAQPASGGGVTYNLVTVSPGASDGLTVSATVSNGLPAGNVTYVQPDITGAFSGTVMGHLYVQSAWESLFDLGQPLDAWTGELAAARYARLAGENGYQARILGSPAYSAAMGPQGQATLDALLKECEAADLGQQFEPRQQLALGYRTLASMCGQQPALSLDYSASEPGGVNGSGDDSGLDPTFDDQLTKNDWTVTRGAASGSQGGTWQYQLNDGSAMSISDPPAGVGDYANSATANVEYDTQLPDLAGWLTRIGTVDDERWPVIPVNLARPAMSALYWDALAAEIGDMTQIASLPDVVLYDPVRQLALGMREALGGFHYTQEYNAVPGSPYEVIILDDPVYGRADTDGSYLFAAIGSSDTSFSVVTLNAQLVVWTTNAADFPFDVNIGGERMTVTNVSGSLSTQTFTVTRSVNGVVKSHPAGADVRLWIPPILSLA